MQTGAGFPWGSSLGLLVLDLAPTSPCLGVLCVTSPATGKAGEEGHSLSCVSSLHGSKPLKGRGGRGFLYLGRDIEVGSQSRSLLRAAGKVQLFGRERGLLPLTPRAGSPAHLCLLALPAAPAACWSGAGSTSPVESCRSLPYPAPGVSGWTARPEQ